MHRMIGRHLNLFELRAISGDAVSRRIGGSYHCAFDAGYGVRDFVVGRL